jgi:hypothetical protein
VLHDLGLSRHFDERRLHVIGVRESILEDACAARDLATLLLRRGKSRLHPFE